MDSFNDIENLWLQQSVPAAPPAARDIIREAEKKLRQVRRKHLFTIGILVGTVLVLATYWFRYSTGGFSRFNMALCCMTGALVWRVLIEYISFRKFQSLRFGNDFIRFTADLTRFYAFRKRVHQIFTPLIYAAYVLGFILLLPLLKANFSTWTYTYFLVTGFGFLLFFAGYIYKQNRKEMQLLGFLKGIENPGDAQEI